MPGVNSWTVVEDPLPIIAQNTGPDDVTYHTGYVVGSVQPRYLLPLHPGTEGEHAVLRWTAPLDSACHSEAYFQNIDLQQVVVNLAIDGTLVSGGPLAFDGYGNNFFVIGQHYFTAGQTVDLIVQSGDAGLKATFDAVPEPAILLRLLGPGDLEAAQLDPEPWRSGSGELGGGGVLLRGLLGEVGETDVIESILAPGRAPERQVCAKSDRKCPARRTE